MPGITIGGAPPGAVPPGQMASDLANRARAISDGRGQAPTSPSGQPPADSGVGGATSGQAAQMIDLLGRIAASAAVIATNTARSAAMAGTGGGAGGGGRFGGGGPFGPSGPMPPASGPRGPWSMRTYREAAFWDSRYNASRSGTRADANWMNSNFDAQNRARQAAMAGSRADAGAENSNRNYIAAGQRADARAMDADYNARQRYQRTQGRAAERAGQRYDAAYDAAHREDARRTGSAYDTDRRLAEYLNRDMDAAARRARAGQRTTVGGRAERMMEGPVADFRASQRAAGQAYDASYREASWINSDMNAAQRSQAAASAARRSELLGIAFGTTAVIGGSHVGRGLRHAGMGSTKGLIEGGLLGMGVTLALGAPQVNAAIQEEFYSRTAPYRDYAKDAYSVGRQNSIYGGDIMSQFYGSDDSPTPAWMGKIGMTTGQAMKTLGAMGGMFQDGAGAASVVQTIGQQQLGPGFSGIDDGALAYSKFLMNSGLTTSTSAGEGFAMNRAGGIDSSLTRMNTILADSRAIGLDAKNVLEQIERGTSITAQAVGRPDVGQTADFLGIFQRGGGMAGRSGQMGLDALQNTQTAAMNLGQSPVGQMVLMAAAHSATNEGGLATLLGGGDAAAGAKTLAGIRATPGGAKMVQNYLDAASKGIFEPGMLGDLQTMMSGTGGVATAYGLRLSGANMGLTASAVNAVEGAVTGRGRGANYVYNNQVPPNAGASMDTHNPSDPRGIRNNNPGNLNFANQPGASREVNGAGGHTEAVFGTMAEGIAAMRNQIQIDVNRGDNTIRKLITSWAPPSENPTEDYIAQVSKAVGIKDTDALDMNDAGQVSKLMKTMISREDGAAWVPSDTTMAAGLSRYNARASGNLPPNGVLGADTRVDATKIGGAEHIFNLGNDATKTIDDYAKTFQGAINSFAGAVKDFAGAVGRQSRQNADASNPTGNPMMNGAVP